MKEDAKTMIKLMGLPVVQAPSEAEAQCAELVRMGIAYATASEDMDALPFGSNFLIRNLTNNKKEQITLIDNQKVLNGFGLSRRQFVDLCVLSGCDYTRSISGIGSTKAL